MEKVREHNVKITLIYREMWPEFVSEVHFFESVVHESLNLGLWHRAEVVWREHILEKYVCLRPEDFDLLHESIVDHDS